MKTLLLPILLLNLLTYQSRAAMLTYAFGGTLTVVPTNDPYAAQWGAVGDAFYGTISYDPVWHNAHPILDPYGGIDTVSYNYRREAEEVYPPESVLSLTLGTLLKQGMVPGTPGTVDAMVTDSLAGDSFVLGGEYTSQFFLLFELQDATGTTLSSTLMPESLSLSAWSSGGFVQIYGWGNSDPQGGYVRGDIAYLVPVVPEPSTLALLAGGLLALWFGRKLICPKGAEAMIRVIHRLVHKLRCNV